MKSSRLFITALVSAAVFWNPSPGLCRPPTGPLKKIFGIVDEVPHGSKKNLGPNGPDLRPGNGVDPSTGSGPGSGGKNTGEITPEEDEILEDLVGLTPPTFSDVGSNPSILPVTGIQPGDINPKPPKLFPEKPGGVKNRQETTIAVDPKSFGENLNAQYGTQLDPLPKDAKPKIVLINHDYYNQYPPNFKVEVNYGAETFVIGLDPKNSGGMVTIHQGQVDFPPGSVLIPKKWYNDVLAGKVPDFRMGPNGKIQQSIDGDWVDYANPHWPYANQ
ncbi:MAG: hypothetical protein RL518_281 [Pseudomonadota bacterium]|jgi:hypothetical protein